MVNKKKEPKKVVRKVKKSGLVKLKPSLSEDQFRYVQKSTINSIKKERENPYNIVYERWR